MELTTDFEIFKKDFYEKFDDFKIFNCAEFNLLKVVLDGLKVNYVSRGKVRMELFWPKNMQSLYLFLQRSRNRKKYLKAKAAHLSLEKWKNTPHLIVDPSGRGRVTENGNAISYYFENIKSALNQKACFILEERNTAKFEFDIAKSDIEIYHIYRPLTSEEKELKEELFFCINKIKKEGNFTSDDIRNIKIASQVFFTQFKIWNEVIKVISPRVCFFILNYQREGFMLALRRNRVNAVELQHGLISSSDIFYCLPQGVKSIREKALFPNYMLVYGNYWRNILLSGYELSADQIQEIGYYVYAQAFETVSNKSELQRFLNGSKYVLITTQTFLHSYFISYVIFLQKEFVRLGISKKIVVKPHPEENSELYKVLNNDFTSVCMYNTEYLLENCEYHISIYSTTLYDALRFKCRNYSLHFAEFSTYTTSLVNDGVAAKLLPDTTPFGESAAPYVQGLRDSSIFFAPFNNRILNNF